MPGPPRSLLYLAFAAIYLIWGSTYLAIRIAIETLPPFLMTGVRFLVAGGLLYAWSRLRGAERPRAAHWRSAAMVGSLLMFGGIGVVSWAEQLVPSGIAAVLVATLPLWMAILDALLFQGPRPGLRTLQGIGCGLIGVGLLVAPSDGADAVHPVGAMLVLMAAGLWALGSLLARRLPLPSSLGLGVAMKMLAGSAVLLVAGLVTGETSRVNLGEVSMASVLALGYLIFIGSIVVLIAYLWLLRVVSPVAVSTYAFVNPIVAVALGWGLAGEVVGPRTALAAGFIVGSVALILSARRESELPRSGDTEPLPAPAPARALRSPCRGN